MVQTKRQINTRLDRNGYFDVERREERAARAFDAADIDTPSDITSIRGYAPDTNIIMSDTERAAAQTAAPAPSAKTALPELEPLYTTLETAKNKLATELPKRPEKDKKPLNQEDLMPSVKTRRIADRTMAEKPVNADARKEEAEAAVERRSESRMSPKTKMLLFVYIAVALALAIAVIATGVSISKAAATADAYAQAISQKQTVIAEQETEIAASVDANTIADKALELGMTYAPSSSDATVSRVEKVEYPEPETHGNAFDKFSDWLSKIVM